MLKRIRKVFLNYIPLLIKTGLLYKIPFLYNLLEIQPSSCTIMITNGCNLRCIMCKQWREPFKNELGTDDWKEIIKDLKKNGIKNIHFTGGEPLLRKDIKELIAYCSSNGFVVGLTTNGILLRKEILENLVSAGLRSVALSIDATGDEYDTIRGVPNSFEKAKESIFVIAETRNKKHIDAYINFTLMKNNIKELRKVKKLADEAKLRLHVCLLDKNSAIFNLDENKNKFWINGNEDSEALHGILDFLKYEKIKNPRTLITNFPGIDFIKEYFKDPRQKQIPCVSSQDRIIIDPYGNLLGGCLSMGNFGNIKDKQFNKLRREKRYRIAKKDMFYKNCPGCSCGYLFNIRCIPTFMVKDLFLRAKHFVFEKK